MTTSTLIKLLSEIEAAYGPLTVRLIDKRRAERAEVRTNSDNTGKEINGQYLAIMPGIVDQGGEL